MTILLSHIICAISPFLLVKVWLENVSRPYGGIIKAWRKAHENDPETSNEDRHDMRNTPDNILNAIVWTTILVANLIAWPLVLLWMMWYKMFPDDFFEEDMM
jgi:hypothetical protein